MAAKKTSVQQRNQTNKILSFQSERGGQFNCGTNIATIDLGTNSCRILITDSEGKLLFRDSISVKLGEGMHAQMRFTGQAIERGNAAFAKYAKLMKKYQVGRYHAVATASCRMAANGVDFIRQIQQQTGIEIDVIDPYEEARLNLKGALLNADSAADYVVVYDVGGGSTEVTLASNDDEPQIIHTISIPWGGRNAAEAFGLFEYQPQAAQNLASVVADSVQKFAFDAHLSDYKGQACLLAISSTGLRLSAMVKKMKIYDRVACDGARLSISELNQAIDDVCKMNLEQRAASIYIGENRAPIFLASCTIFKTIYDTLGFESLTASLKGALEALNGELIQNG